MTSIDFYTIPGPMTDAGQYADLLNGLPTTLPELVASVQGFAVHVFWAKRYGLELSEEREQEVTLRLFQQKLPRILELDPAPLSQPRELSHRLVSNCRDFSVMTAGILIHQGVPARARCGFGTYFMPNHFEDHWVVEYWNRTESRWVMFDPQIDELMKTTLNLSFDPLDMPPGQFVTAGQAWQMCRSEGADPDQFGIFDMHGWDFIRGNLYRDFLALNKVEILPWDFWPGMGPQVESFTPDDWEKHDHMAALTTRPEACFDEIRALYENTPALHVPAEWLRTA